MNIHTIRSHSIRIIVMASLAVTCSSPQRNEPTRSSEEELSSCSSHSVSVIDLHGDFADIWAGRETTATGKQAEPTTSVVVDFNANVQGSLVSGQFVPQTTDGNCGSTIAAKSSNTIVPSVLWGSTTSDASRPAAPGPYNVIAQNTISGVVSAAGPLAAGGDVVLTSFSVNSTARQAVGIVAGGHATLSNGSVFGNVSYGLASAIPQTVSVSGTKSQQAFSVASTFSSLQTLSTLLAEESANTTVTNTNGNLTFTGTHSGVNVFQVTSDTLAQASSLQITVPAGAGALINVSGGSVTIQNKGVTLSGATNAGLLWNLPGASFASISSIALPGSILAPNAALTFSSGNLAGTIVVRSFTSSGSGSIQYAPLNVSLMIGSSSPSSVVLTPATPLVRGCTYEFVLPSTVPLTSSNACLATALNVTFRVAAHPSTSSERELAGATTDPALHTARVFSARPGINTPLADVWHRYQDLIGSTAGDLVPLSTAQPSSTIPTQALTTYQQYESGYPVFNYGYSVAAEHGLFRSAVGKLIPSLAAPSTAPITSASALQAVTQFLHVATLPWVSDPAHFHAPIETLGWLQKSVQPAASDFALVWALNTAGSGLSRSLVVVDALRGVVLEALPLEVRATPTPLDPNATYQAQTTGVVNALYGGGLQSINVAQYQSFVGLTVTTLATGPTLAAGILGVDFEANPPSSGPPPGPTFIVDPTPSTPWTNTEPVEQAMATAEWGLQRANAYLKALQFQPNPSAPPWTSIDGLGHQRVIVAWNEPGSGDQAIAYSNASTADFANINAFDGTPGPPVEPATLPHEFDHAFLPDVRRSVGLDPFDLVGEADSLSEGLADLFAIGSVHLQLGEIPSWFCIQDATTCIRNIQDPLSVLFPVYYRGANYTQYTDTSTCDTEDDDYCFGHHNSSLISHWGYLLSFGSNAPSSPNPCNLSVTPLAANPDDAMRMVVNLSHLAAGTRDGVTIAPDEPTFADFRDATLEIARELVTQGTFPSDAPSKLELAWYAVGLGPQYQGADTNVTPAAGAVTPADDSSLVNPWQTFTWPVDGDGQAGTAWDFQIADGPFDTNLRLEQDNITTTVITDNQTMASFSLALPFDSTARYFWRVRPHTSDAWLGCYPVHSLWGTTSPDLVQDVQLETTLDDGTVEPGELRAFYLGVSNATQYRFGIGTSDNNCVGDSDVFQTTQDATPEEILQPSSMLEEFHRLEPSTTYFLEIQPIGPNDFSGDPSLGACFKLQFTTAGLSAPSTPVDTSPDVFVDGVGNVAGIDSGAHLAWSVPGGTQSSTVSFFERDENGACSTTPIDTEVVDTLCPPDDSCSFCNACSATLATTIASPPDPSGYCWSVTATAANGVQSQPSPTAEFQFVDHASPSSPGISVVNAFGGNPSPLLGDSAESDVTLNWGTDPFTSHYMVRVSRWPHGPVQGTLPDDPPNCVITQKIQSPDSTGFSCLTPTAVTFSQEVSGTSVTVPAALASGGRYCWTVWPLYADPTNPNAVGARQPLVETDPSFCYTSGPIKPTIVPDQQQPDGGYPQGKPITGHIDFPYIPCSQYRLLASSSDIQFGSGCVPIEGYLGYPDVFDCQVTFTIKNPSANATYTLGARTWNSPFVLDGTGSLPPEDPAFTLPDVTQDFLIAPCGDDGQACCNDTKCNTADLICQGGSCVSCGDEGESCCAGNRCASAGDVCESGVCKACGGNGQPCCAQGDACHPATQSDGRDTLVCAQGSCTLCGQTGVGCCPHSSQPGFNQECFRSNTIVEDDCRNGICVACGEAGQSCCEPNFCNNISCVHSPSEQTGAPGNCKVCGRVGQACCPGIIIGAGPCVPGGLCESNGLCEQCGQPGQFCCLNPQKACADNSTCQSGSCPNSSGSGGSGGNGGVTCPAGTLSCKGSPCLDVFNIPPGGGNLTEGWEMWQTDNLGPANQLPQWAECDPVKGWVCNPSLNTLPLPPGGVPGESMIDSGTMGCCPPDATAILAGGLCDETP